MKIKRVLVDEFKILDTYRSIKLFGQLSQHYQVANRSENTWHEEAPVDSFSKINE